MSIETDIQTILRELVAARRDIAELRAALAPRAPATAPSRNPGQRELVTINHFVTKMLGMSARHWYYHHTKDPGMPQRIYVGRKPMLVFDECIAYIERLAKERDPDRPKRHPGRPAKVIAP